MRHKRALLAFEDDARCKGLEFMPHVLEDVNAIDAVFLAEDDACDHRAVIVIGG